MEEKEKNGELWAVELNEAKMAKDWAMRIKERFINDDDKFWNDWFAIAKTWAVSRLVEQGVAPPWRHHADAVASDA